MREGEAPPFVFNASPLSCFARAGRIALLHEICGEVRCVVTEAVRHELRRGAAARPELRAALRAEWLDQVRVDGLAELSAFAEYARLLGSARERDVGEAATLAWAETHGAIAIIDERAAVRAARQRKVAYHGTLWLVVRGLRQAVLAEPEAVGLVGTLLDSGAYFPFSSADEFIPWAREAQLLERDEPQP